MPTVMKTLDCMKNRNRVSCSLTFPQYLGPCCSKWAWGPVGMGITGELIRNSDSSALSPALLNQNLHLNKIPEWFIFTLTFERHWTRTQSGVAKRSSVNIVRCFISKYPHT